jgi:sulfur-oxidizing protein SoxB
VGGLSYTCDPTAGMGRRIDNLRLGDALLEADRVYKVAGWAPVAEEAKSAGNKQIWEVVEPWLQSKKVIAPRKLNEPALKNVLPNPGIA